MRRSPPSVLLLHVLPLDLHVLGLSLAFILSQDQTLRCKFVFFVSLKQPSSEGLLRGRKSAKSIPQRIRALYDPFKITPGFTIYIPV